jgi:hypothetical protein
MPNRYQASDDKRQAVLEGALAQENNTLEAEGNDLTSDNPSRMSKRLSRLPRRSAGEFDFGVDLHATDGPQVSIHLLEH